MKQLSSTSKRWNGVITSEQGYRLLFAFVWMQNTVLGFAEAVLKRLPVIGMLGSYIIPAIMVCLFLLAIPHIVKHLRYGDILFLLTAVLIVLGTMIIYPENAAFIEKDLWRILVLTFPMYIIGLCYDHEVLKKDIFWYSMISVAFMYLYQQYMLSQGRELDTDNMDSAYNVLPSILYLFYWAFENKKLRYWVMPAVGVALALSYGTRGPFLIIVVYCAAQLLVNAIKQRTGVRRIAGIVLLITAVALVFTTNILSETAVFLQERFEKAGFSTRIFDYFIEGDIADDSGRGVLAEQTKRAIMNNLLFGLGFYGDRVVIGGYAHNLFLEVWCHFGILAGSALLIVLFALPVLAIIRNRNKGTRDIVLLLACMVFLKLMMSGSYAVEPYLFLTMGISINARRQNTTAIQLRRC